MKTRAVCDYYLQKIITKKTTIPPQRHRAHRDFLKGFLGSLQHRYPCEAVGSSARLPLDCGCLARLRSWPLPSGRAVWGCGAVVRAGWLAWKALVSGGRGPGRAWYLVEMNPG